MEIFTVCFFGHRTFENEKEIEQELERILNKIIDEKEYVEFLVGRNGDFDILVSSVVHRTKRKCEKDNFDIVLVLPYPMADYTQNTQAYNDYFDFVEICEKSDGKYFKNAINRDMVERSDLVICYVEHESTGAYKTMKYAQNLNRQVINIYEIINLK